MSPRAHRILGWVFAAPVILFSAFASVMKFVPVEAGSDAAAMMDRLGMTGMMYQIGILELIVLLLFVIPRTSTVGFVLMIGYMGGALATNLTHGFSQMEVIPLYVIFLLLTLSAWFRNPELAQRLLGKSVPAKA